jgi:hypothetical protein
MVCSDRNGEVSSSSFGSSTFMKLSQVSRRVECKLVGIYLPEKFLFAVREK